MTSVCAFRPLNIEKFPLQNLSMACSGFHHMRKNYCWEYKISDLYCWEYKISFQFSYKKPLISEGERSLYCCQSIPLSCWQHCIKEVKIGRSRKFPGRAYIDVQSYSSEDGEILEKIDDVWRSLCV